MSKAVLAATNPNDIVVFPPGEIPIAQHTMLSVIEIKQFLLASRERYPEQCIPFDIDAWFAQYSDDAQVAVMFGKRS